MGVHLLHFGFRNLAQNPYFGVKNDPFLDPFWSKNDPFFDPFLDPKITLFKPEMTHFWTKSWSKRGPKTPLFFRSFSTPFLTPFDRFGQLKYGSPGVLGRRPKKGVSKRGHFWQKRHPILGFLGVRFGPLFGPLWAGPASTGSGLTSLFSVLGP